MTSKRLRSAGIGPLVVLLLACGAADDPLGSPRRAERGLPAAELTEVAFEGFSGDALSVSVKARSARIDTSARRAELRQVDISFREAQRGVVEVHAERGEVHLDTQDFALSGGVEGTTEAGERFSTEELIYRSAQRRIWSETPVRLDRANLVMEADGMEIVLDEATRRIRLTGRVRGRMDSS